jgi:hypothetical protein
MKSIRLSYRQRNSAFYSISWPAAIGVFVLYTLWESVFNLEHDSVAFWLTGQIVFYSLQAAFTRRLFVKKYQTFLIQAIRENESLPTKLTFRESLNVWWWIFAPQLALVLLVNTFFFFFESKIPPDTIGSISTLATQLRFLFLGPFGIGIAMKMPYRGFRLEAFSRLA